MVHECYPGLTDEVMASLFIALGSERLAQITAAIMGAPYSYRAGWPDLTMTNGEQMLWAEVKDNGPAAYEPDIYTSPHEATSACYIRVVQLV
jgi:hypothetical protein